MLRISFQTEFSDLLLTNHTPAFSRLFRASGWHHFFDLY